MLKSLLTTANLPHHFLFSTIKLSCIPGSKLPPHPQKFLPPRGKSKYSQPGAPFTRFEIRNFDKHYVVQRKVQRVDFKAGKLHERVEMKDVREILQGKVKTQEQFEEFVGMRGERMRWQESMFAIQKIMQKEFEAKKETLEKIMAALKKTPKYPHSICKFVCKFLLKYKGSAELLEKFANGYINFLNTQQNEKADLKFILSLPYELVTQNRKIITQFIKQDLGKCVDWFSYLSTRHISRQEVKVLDQIFVNNFLNLNIAQKINIMDCFGRLGLKGIFVELIKDFVVKDMKTNSLSDILKLLIPLTTLNALQQSLFLQLEPNLHPFILMAKPVDLSILIQIAHKICSGSQEFWHLIENTKHEFGYSELFAVLGGYERNLKYNPHLFIKLLALDPDMQAMDIQDENNFLKLMLIYYGNVSAMDENHTHKTVIQEKIRNKLKQIYQQKHYKIFTMFFLWLLETNPPKKAQYLKLIYRQPEEHELFDIITKQRKPSDEFLKFMRDQYAYYDQNPTRAAIEDFIRKRKLQFEGRHH